MTRLPLANLLRLGFFGLVLFSITMYSLSLHRFSKLPQPHISVTKVQFLARDAERNLSESHLKEETDSYAQEKKAPTTEGESRSQKRRARKHDARPAARITKEKTATSGTTGQVSNKRTVEAAKESEKNVISALKDHVDDQPATEKTGQVSRIFGESHTGEKIPEQEESIVKAAPTLPKGRAEALREFRKERTTPWEWGSTKEAHEKRLAPATRRQKKEARRKGNKKTGNDDNTVLERIEKEATLYDKYVEQAISDIPSKGMHVVMRELIERLQRAHVAHEDIGRAVQVVVATGTRASNATVPSHKAKRRNKPAARRQRDSVQRDSHRTRDALEPPPTSSQQPVHDPLTKTPKKGAVKRLPFSPEVPYLGVLVDAGRHYFSIAWLKRLIRYLHYMRYNLIHFRLTDDQAFNVRLDSHPEFAKPSAVYSNGTVYSTSELRDLVAYAQKYKITVMPEINVPGHAGAWHGIPGMLVPCPNFICRKGYGIPLNIGHPEAMDIIKDIIKEVSEIFHTSPFLHLGGDEVHMAAPCFLEAGFEMFDYESFETKLNDIVSEVLGEGKEVVRWEMTGQKSANARVVTMEHYWRSRDYAKNEKGTAYPFFASQGLYFDSNEQIDALKVYENTRAYLTSSERPTAIVAGTFELGMDTWLDRNVMGRLLAVAMGTSAIDFTAEKANDSTTDIDSFYQSYFDHCKSLAFGEGMCSLYGMPAVSEQKYKTAWDGHWNQWKSDICERLTISRPSRALVSSNKRWQRAAKDPANIASAEFWDKIFVPPNSLFAEEHFDSAQLKEHHLPALFRDQIVAYRGVILDLVCGIPGHNVTERLEHIVDIMAELGFNLLQLRIMDDLEFLLSLDSRLKLQRVNKEHPNYDKIIPQIVEYAYHRGIMVMPEISVTTRSGGWSDTLPHVPCPNVICDTGRGLAVDLSQSSVFPVLFMALKKLRNMFSSKFIHLGFDERKESMACFDEADMSADFDSFEARLEEILRIERIPLEHVVRWENTEKKTYAHRAGSVTHYRLSNGPTNSSFHWFASTNLAFDDPESLKLDAWMIYKQTHSLAMKSPTGILASVGVMDVKSWTMLNIKGRLLAVAMGLSSHTFSSNTFPKTYNSTCQKLVGYHCDMFGAVNVMELWRKERQEASEYRMNTTCNMRTTEIKKRIARKGVLVE